ncbi:MAG: undecaprenyl/decaprenyl-phosphate alpha-N-acetylglucosaminyl 1-phosphate transferase [Chloroflexota bacterium]|nr:undecaprenyl/decaprenyl-phosphate alpha-N-acetylglucosaminyl 1-phosphate transferase [Chloroflexota bacterium]
MAIPEKRLALRLGFVDLPDERRKHRGIRSRLGGPGMFLAFLAGLLASRQPLDAKLLGVLLGSALCIAIGLVDDKRQPFRHELGALPQLFGQLAAAGLAIAAGVSILAVRDPRALGPFGGLLQLPLAISIPLTLAWITGMINTVNFLDGMDGLATGVVAIGAAVLAVASLRLGQPAVALQCLALAGAAVGFLPHNLPPARLFMGTTGAWFLGYALATLSIIGGAKLSTALLVIGVPVFDVALLIVLRTRRGQPFWQADRSHLFHRLLDVGLSHRTTLVLYYCLSAAFGAYALAFTTVQSSGWGLKIYGLAGLLAVTIFILAFLARTNARR